MKKVSDLFRIIVSDEVPEGQVFLVSGLGRYSLTQAPKHIVSAEDDGSVLGFNDAVKIIDCGGRGNEGPQAEVAEWYKGAKVGQGQETRSPK